MKKRALAPVLTAAMVLGLTACGGSSNGAATDSAADGQTAGTETEAEAPASATGEKILSVQVGPNPETIDPALNSAVDGGNMLLHSFECLLAVDEDGQLIPGQAESYEVSEDGLTWTFHLRKDAKWSDGSAVTSADFVNTIKRSLDGKTSKSIYADMLSPIVGATEAYAGTASVDNVGVTAPDDYTIEFKLVKPCSYFLKLIAMQCCYPSKAGIATNENETWYTDPKTNLANGAFYMTEYVQGQYYKLKKNPNYYDADKVYLEDITVKFIDDATAAVSAYKTNEVDFATNLPAYVMSEYQGKSDLVLQPNITTRFILFNVTKAPFNNDKVRRAISMALSRAEICKTVGDDYEASTQFIAKYMLSNLGTGKKFSDESGEMVTEDIAKAKSLLAEAGYPNGAGFPTVTYNYPNNEQDKLIAQAIQAQLKSALNINVELNGMESQVCVSERKSGNFDMTRHNWTADYDDAMDYLLMWTSTSGLNDAGIKDADYDKLCEDATAELDETKRNTIMHDAEKLLVTDKAYVAPLATNKTICLLNPKYTGYSFDSSGQILLKFIKAAE